MAQPAASPTNPKVVRFGLFELDLDARELRKSGVKIKLHEQPFQILATLLERPGTVVTREELQKKLWPSDTFVDFDLSLNSAVKKLRQALSDDSENPRYVETLYRRGYRFIAPVTAPMTGLVTSSPMNGAANSAANQVELVPGLAAPSPAMPQPVIAPSNSGRRIFIYVVLLAVLLILAALAAYRLIPPQSPRVLGFTQITHDALYKVQLFSDGERLYLTEMQGDDFVASQVSASGGETSIFPVPLANVEIDGIAPNGSALVVSSFKGTFDSAETWLLPLPSGPPRLIPDFHCKGVSWSADGKQAVYSVGPEIYIADADLSHSRRIATAPGSVSYLRFSPDGRKLRFDLHSAANSSLSIWEINADGSGLRPLLPGWNNTPHECCGSWTPDGRYFVFESFRDQRHNVWALPERSSWFGRASRPIQLTNGPLDFEDPVLSKDGKRIFVVGSQSRCELTHYDGKSAFDPYLGGGSISDLAFSPDAKWIAYVSVPDGHLWRSRIDGTDRLQLTPDGMKGGLPRWSPDGKHIAFMGTNFTSDWRVYIIHADGTGLRDLIPGAKSGYDPTWSADGKSLAMGFGSPGLNSSGIVIYDFTTGKTSPLPGAEQMFSPRWSPDGRYIAAITNDSLKLMLFDRSNQQWRQLAKMPMGYPSWSHDSQYIYFDTSLNEDPAFYRVRISDHKLERLFSLKGVRRFWGQFGQWTGLAPDDSPLLVRDIGTQEIYAIDWQAP